MRKVVNVLDKILAFFAFAFSVLFVMVVITQVFSRTFLPRTPAWTEELARYFFIYAVASAGGLAVRQNAYVAVDIFTGMIPEKYKKYHQLVINLFLMAFCAFFEVKSVFKFAFLKNRMVSTALEIPMQYIYFAMVILFGLLTLSYLIEIILLLTGKKTDPGEEAAQ